MLISQISCQEIPKTRAKLITIMSQNKTDFPGVRSEGDYNPNQRLGYSAVASRILVLHPSIGTMAKYEEGYNSVIQGTSFESISGKGFYPDMLIREIK